MSVHDFEQGSHEWLQYKCGRIGASKIKDVMAKGKGKSRASYMAEIIAARMTGQYPESYCSPDMQWGIDQEESAVECYEFLTGNKTEIVGFVDHPTIDMAGASPDRLVNDDGLIECKCPKTNTHIEYLLAGVVPKTYHKQIQFQLAVTGRQWCDFVSYDCRLTEDLQLFIIRMYRDEEIIQEIESEVVRFICDAEEKIEKLKKVAHEIQQTPIINKDRSNE